MSIREEKGIELLMLDGRFAHSYSLYTELS